MAYQIVIDPDFRAWYRALDKGIKARLVVAIDMLEEKGPLLRHPQTSGIHGSRHGHMREETEEVTMSSWQELKDEDFTREEQAGLRAEALREIALGELRQAMELTQTQLAAAMNMNQASVSKIERQADMLVGTLRNFLSAMGAELEIVARFANGEAVRINQFEAAAGRAPGGETATGVTNRTPVAVRRTTIEDAEPPRKAPRRKKATVG